MTLIEAARVLKCSQNRLRDFHKEGRLKKVRGPRVKVRGVVPYLVDLNEARRLLTEYRNAKHKMDKVLHVVMPDSMYERIDALSKRTGFTLSRVGRMIVEIGLAELEKKQEQN